MQDFPGRGIHNVVHWIPAPDAVAEGVDDVALLHHFAHPNAMGCAAVVDADNHILGHVHQTPGQVAGVRSPQSRIG